MEHNLISYGFVFQPPSDSIDKLECNVLQKRLEQKIRIRHMDTRVCITLVSYMVVSHSIFSTLSSQVPQCARYHNIYIVSL